MGQGSTKYSRYRCLRRRHTTDELRGEVGTRTGTERRQQVSSQQIPLRERVASAIGKCAIISSLQREDRHCAVNNKAAVGDDGATRIRAVNRQLVISDNSETLADNSYLAKRTGFAACASHRSMESEREGYSRYPLEPLPTLSSHQTHALPKRDIILTKSHSTRHTSSGQCSATAQFHYKGTLSSRPVAHFSQYQRSLRTVTRRRLSLSMPETSLQQAKGTAEQLSRSSMSPRSALIVCDDISQERIDLLHGITKYILKRSYLAPIRKPRTILDISLGSSAWVREMALEFPKARIVSYAGVCVAKAADVHFSATRHHSEVCERLPYADGSFDYIRQCLSFSIITPRDARWTWSELHRLCRTGGWVEIVEVYRRFHNRGPCGERLDMLLGKLLSESGISSCSVCSIDSELSAAGFVDVTQRTVSIPVGDWGGAPGTLMRRSIEMLMRSLAYDIIQLPGASIDSAQYFALIDSFLEETERRQTYMDIYYFYGRRP